MKTKNHPVIKNLIDFVDDPYYNIMEERRKRQNAQAWIVVLAICTLAVISYLVIQLDLGNR